MGNIYFVTYRIVDEDDKTAVCGDNDPSHDYWVKTDHYDSEEKMINAVFNRILDEELLDIIEADIEENLSGSVNWGKSVDKKFIKELNKESAKIKKALDNLFPKFNKDDDWNKQHKAFDKHCKTMSLEDKKKFI